MKERRSESLIYKFHDDSIKAISVEPMYKASMSRFNQAYYANDDGTVDVKIQNITPPEPTEDLFKESIRITDPVKYAKEYVKIDEEKQSYKKMGFKKYFTKKMKSFIQILSKNNLLVPILGGIVLAAGITLMFKSFIVALIALPIIAVAALNSKFTPEESLRYDYDAKTYYYKSIRDRQNKENKQSQAYRTLLKEWKEQQRLIPQKTVFLAVPEQLFRNIDRTSGKEWIKIHETLSIKQEAEQDLIQLKEIQKNSSAEVFKNNIEENMYNIKQTIKKQQKIAEKYLKNLEEDLEINIRQEQQEELLQVLSSMEGKYTSNKNDDIDENEEIYSVRSKRARYI